ncbi:MAG: tRNA (adenosine(37)-N6)-threonylcarbamoyltransferase complex ATPase subunit type 1 TsaE [Candidatus Latescibacterota bacterium]|nr:MAG: tRNA (adenosine(37)-N6)-threonylcarbamoyltransferase complex ATPase subunit type 1 TsaE [Candidatus Latescibacterota bacterium]
MPESRPETTIITTNSESETERLGVSLGCRIDKGLCISLVGALGSGKSVLVRGICKGLGVEEDVLSPTFILYEEYVGRVPVIHLDLYRLDHERDIEELGVWDRLGDGSVVLVEWGDRSVHLFGVSDIVINLEIIGDTERRIAVRSSSDCAGVLEGL